MRLPGLCYFISEGTIVWRRWPRAIDLVIPGLKSRTHKYTPIAFCLVWLLIWLLKGYSSWPGSCREINNLLLFFFCSFQHFPQNACLPQQKIWVQILDAAVHHRYTVGQKTTLAVLQLFILHSFTLSSGGRGLTVSNQCQIWMLIES